MTDKISHEEVTETTTARNKVLDKELLVLIFMAYKGLQANVTLNCGGQIVSGTLCSLADWYTEQADAMESATMQGTEDSAAEVMAPFISRFREEAEAVSGIFSPEDETHLSDLAHFTLRGRQNPQTGQFEAGVRGRLADVSWWHQGGLRP